MNLRTILRRLRTFERRWIPPRPERDAHEATVRSRLQEDARERVTDEGTEPDPEELPATDPPAA